MNEIIYSLLDAIKSYYLFFINGNLSDWWFPFVTAFVLYLLITGLAKVFSAKHPYTKIFKIFFAIIIISCVVLFVFIAVSCSLWARTNHFNVHKTQFFYLITLLSILLVIIISFLNFRSKFSQERSKDIINQPFTRNEKEKFSLRARRSFNKLKLWLLLPILGFLFLFLNKPPNLISFLIDNSSSMDVIIEFGKDALSNTFMELGEQNDIILGWFTERNPKTSVDEIIKETNVRNLEGENHFFEICENAIPVVDNLPRTQSTPLCEGIWANYLFTKTKSQNKKYNKVVLIIITDGGDNLLSSDEDIKGFFCENEEFDSFFNEVSCINLGGSLESPFFKKAAECGYYIEEDGTTQSSYTAALNYILAEFKSDWYFITWLAIFYLFGVLIVFCITPKRD